MRRIAKILFPMLYIGVNKLKNVLRFEIGPAVEELRVFPVFWGMDFADRDCPVGNWALGNNCSQAKR